MTFRSNPNISNNQTSGLHISNSVTNTDLVVTGKALTNSQPMHVAIVDGSGNQITAFGGSGGTASNFGSVFPAQGTAAGAIDNSGNMAGLNLDSSGNLKVSGSLSIGGTTDNSAYTAGTSTGTPSFGFYHSTIDTVTDGRSAAIGMTNKRAMFVNLQNSSGTEIGTSSVPIQVSLANTGANSTAVKVDGTGGTFPATQSGTWNITNISGTISLPTGAATAANQTNASQKSQIVDGSGNVIASTSNALNVKPQMASNDFYPFYNVTNIGGLPLQTDPTGSLITRGAITTDEGAHKINFVGSNPFWTIASVTFTNGSATVTGSGFSTSDLHFGDWIRLAADAESAWAQISFISSDTSLTLFTTYTGTGGTGTANVSGFATSTGTGATISVASGSLTLATGTTNASQTIVYTGATNGSNYTLAQFSVSQRVANQDLYFGYESQMTGTVKSFSRFHFDGTTNTTVKTETAWNPTGAPSASETESNTVTLPASATTASVNTYKVDQQFDKVIFSVNDVVLAVHRTRIPHVYDMGNNAYQVGFRTLNGTGASSTSIVCSSIFHKNFDRVDVIQATPGQADTYQQNVLIDGTTPTQKLSISATGAAKVDGSAVTQPVSLTSTTITGTVAVTESGTWNVGSSAATGSAVPANAFYTGALGQTALPTAGSAGNLTGNLADKFGRQVVLPGTMRDLVGTQTTTITSSTAETTVVIAIASTFNDLTALVISNTSATAARLDFRDTTAGSILFSIYVPAGDVRGVAFNRPIPQTSVNTNWTAQSSASVADLRIYAVWDKNK